MQATLSAVRQSLGEIPIVDDELRKAAGEEDTKDESVAAVSGGNITKLVTADGTYATQSAFSQVNNLNSDWLTLKTLISDWLT